MNRPLGCRRRAVACSLLFLAAALPESAAVAAPDRVIAWNDLGMHCMDSDYSVFSILPPFNNLNVHLIANGKLVTTATGYTLTYEGVADPGGSINTSSVGKTDFWTYVPALFGVSLPLDTGLAGYSMPGPGNVPQNMGFDGTWDWFHGEGIPMTPYDDALQNNQYPMLKVRAENATHAEIASTVTVVPVSDEMDCRLCHASGSSPFAKPDAGWVFDANDEKDFRLNILRLHDERAAPPAMWSALLTTVGYNTAGLEATVVIDGTPILCARCHGSNALPGTGQPGIEPLTEAIHGLHSGVVDPAGMGLDEELNRTSCYTCHPGSETRCLRGAMGKAVAADGSLAMQCQSCHGKMSDVGAAGRVGWLEQPACQNCHTGTAVKNAGEIRFTSVFDALGTPHVAADPIFATTSNVPAPGFSLYRFSSGHGDMQCSACHGSPHAIYPALHDSDNVQNTQLQGHEGTLVECSTCHGSLSSSTLGGPHGMHRVGQAFIDAHGDVVENGGSGQCKACHGGDFRGTVLSRTHADRTLTSKYGSKQTWRGFQVSCYLCHNGPSSESSSSNSAPVVSSKSVNTPNDVPVQIDLTGTDPNNDPLSYRIVSQSKAGTVGLVGASATYHPAKGFVGMETFTFAAWDGKTNSNLATVTVNVQPASCQGSADPYGFGCPGTGDHLPTMDLTGCPSPGQNVTLEIANGLGGSVAYLLFGLQPGIQLADAGCVIRVSPVLPIVFTLPLGGSGPGAGSISLPATIPMNAATGSFTMQAFIKDAGMPHGYSATNGLQISIQ